MSVLAPCRAHRLDDDTGADHGGNPNPRAGGEWFVALAQRTPHLAADRHPTTAIRVARLDVDGDDSGLADETTGADAAG